MVKKIQLSVKMLIQRGKVRGEKGKQSKRKAQKKVFHLKKLKSRENVQITSYPAGKFKFIQKYKFTCTSYPAGKFKFIQKYKFT